MTALKLLHYFKADMQVLDSAKMLPLHRAVCASQAMLSACSEVFCEASVVEFLIEQRSDPQALS